jgi:hypothetical protein
LAISTPNADIEHHAAAKPRFMSVLEFESLLSAGIPASELEKYRYTRISGYESFSDYISFLRSLGAIRQDSEGRFVRA